MLLFYAQFFVVSLLALRSGCRAVSEHRAVLTYAWLCIALTGVLVLSLYALYRFCCFLNLLRVINFYVGKNKEKSLGVLNSLWFIAQLLRCCRLVPQSTMTLPPIPLLLRANRLDGPRDILSGFR